MICGEEEIFLFTYRAYRCSKKQRGNAPLRCIPSPLGMKLCYLKNNLCRIGNAGIRRIPAEYESYAVVYSFVCKGNRNPRKTKFFIGEFHRFVRRNRYTTDRLCFPIRMPFRYRLSPPSIPEDSAEIGKTHEINLAEIDKTYKINLAEIGKTHEINLAEIGKYIILYCKSTSMGKDTIFFKRKMYERMLKWKNERNGDSALLIQGAR